MKTEKCNWLASFDDEKAQEDLNAYIQTRRLKDELQLNFKALESTLKDNTLSMYQISRTTRLAEDYEKAISTGTDALAVIPSVDVLDEVEQKTAHWWQIAIIVSNSYYHYMHDHSSTELHARADKFQNRVTGLAGSDLFTDPVLLSWSLSRLAVFYTCQHEFFEDHDNAYIEEARARSVQAVQKWDRLAVGVSPSFAPQSVKTCIHETHSLVLLSHFQSTNVSLSLTQALESSTIIVDGYLPKTEVDNLTVAESRASRLCSHGTIQSARYRHLQALNDDEATSALKQAIDAGKRAKEQRHNNTRIRFHVLSSLAAWYCELMEHTENLAWGEDGFTQLEELGTMATLPTAMMVRSSLYEIQYRLLKKRHDKIMAGEKLDLAISTLEVVVSKLSSDDRSIGQQYKRLADMRYKKFDSGYGSETDLDRAKVCLEKAINTGNASLSIQLQAAFELAMIHLQAKDFPEAHKFLQRTVSLLPLSKQHQIPPRDLRDILRHASTYAEYAASVALEAGNPLDIALQSLESSRCIISGLSMRLKVDLSALYKINIPLASKYDELRRLLLRELRNKDMKNDAFRASLDVLSTAMAAQENEIRELEEFQDFQKPLSVEKMKELASQGPIIVINVSKLRSDAFIVTKEEITLINLPCLSYQELEPRINVLEKLGNGGRQNFIRFDDSPIPTDTDPADVLQWLWDEAVHEIMDSAPLQTSKRIWWITTGIASRVPFHAAGNHSQGSTDNVIARAKSSYISSFAALRFAQQQAKEALAVSSSTPLHDTRMLLVTVTKNPPGYTNLETKHEIKAIKEVFLRIGTEEPRTRLGNIARPSGRFMHLEAPSPATVLYSLPLYSFVHFACHGTNVAHDPSKSGLVLIEGKRAKTLTVSELETLPLFEFGEVGEIAYLSACSTAQIPENGALPDEALHLGNVLQALGYTHVVATLWGANDEAAGEVAKVFYKTLLIRENEAISSSDISKRLDAAGSLHEAIMSYRDDHRGNEHALAWVPFIHIGA